jgi:hypothetical protein
VENHEFKAILQDLVSKTKQANKKKWGTNREAQVVECLPISMFKLQYCQIERERERRNEK